MLIQACQQSQDFSYIPVSSDMARRGSPEENTHIILNRPHTVLLLASMRDGFAARGAYTDAIAQELRLARNKLDIQLIHSQAVKQLQDNYGDDQTPELRSTLKKRLLVQVKSSAVNS